MLTGFKIHQMQIQYSEVYVVRCGKRLQLHRNTLLGIIPLVVVNLIDH